MEFLGKQKNGFRRRGEISCPESLISPFVAGFKRVPRVDDGEVDFTVINLAE
jgi:hypothetical protein